MQVELIIEGQPYLTDVDANLSGIRPGHVGVQEVLVKSPLLGPDARRIQLNRLGMGSQDLGRGTQIRVTLAEPNRSAHLPLALAEKRTLGLGGVVSPDKATIY